MRPQCRHSLHVFSSELARHSPSWHRAERKRRSKARRRVRLHQAAGTAPPRKDLHLLRSHHSKPCYKSDLMPRGWEKPKGGGKQQSASWGYWSGAWKQHPKSYWQEDGPQTFPAYDDKTRTSALRKEVQAKQTSKPRAGEDLEDPSANMTSELQDYINQTRKAEQRVRQLNATREQKEALWAKWQEDMKKSFLKEETRHVKAMQQLDRDLTEAVAAREEARQQIRQYIQSGPAAMEEPEEPTFDWESLTRQWRQEQQDIEAPHAVLQRAMQSKPPGISATTTPGSGLMSQEAAARLFMATMAGQVMSGHHGGPPMSNGPHPPPESSAAAPAGDAGPMCSAPAPVAAPYVASPTTRPPDHTMTSPETLAGGRPGSVTRQKPGARVPLKGAPLQPVHTQPVTKITTKLEARRTALLSEQAARADQDHATDLPAEPPNQEGETRATGPPRGQNTELIEDDSDEQDQEGQRNGSLDGLG